MMTFDHTKHTCGDCLFFQSLNFCMFHDVAVCKENHACPNFERIPDTAEEKKRQLYYFQTEVKVTPCDKCPEGVYWPNCDPCYAPCPFVDPDDCDEIKVK